MPTRTANVNHCSSNFFHFLCSNYYCQTEPQARLFTPQPIAARQLAQGFVSTLFAEPGQDAPPSARKTNAQPPPPQRMSCAPLYHQQVGEPNRSRNPEPGSAA